MKIEYIKQTFDGEVGYKVKPFDWCCNKLRDINYFSLVNDCDTYDWDSDCLPSMMLHISEEYREYCETFIDDCNYKINFCPFCGEAINVIMIGKKNVTEEYKKLNQQRENLWKECRNTDSKKKEHELSNKVKELDKKINGFYGVTIMEQNND